MPEPAKKLIHVVCVILENRDGQIFVAKRPEGKALAGGWEFPGGKIEEGESHEAALMREIHEELRISIEIDTALPPSSYDYDFGTVVLYPYRASIVSGVINLTEHPEGRWVSRQELTKLDWVPADIPIMRALLDQTEAYCLFCETSSNLTVLENEHAYAKWDQFPVTKHHLLILPKRHATDYFKLTQVEKIACDALLTEGRNLIKSKDHSVTGFNIGMNCGADAGQTIFHCHIHLIPRRAGDVKEPRGGVRHTIPGKGAY